MITLAIQQFSLPFILDLHRHTHARAHGCGKLFTHEYVLKITFPSLYHLFSFFYASIGPHCVQGGAL